MMTTFENDKNKMVWSDRKFVVLTVLAVSFLADSQVTILVLKPCSIQGHYRNFAIRRLSRPSKRFLFRLNIILRTTNRNSEIFYTKLRDRPGIFIVGQDEADIYYNIICPNMDMLDTVLPGVAISDGNRHRVSFTLFNNSHAVIGVDGKRQNIRLYLDQCNNDSAESNRTYREYLQAITSETKDPDGCISNVTGRIVNNTYFSFMGGWIPHG